MGKLPKMHRKEIHSSGFSEFSLCQSFFIHICWYPCRAEMVKKLGKNPWKLGLILAVVKLLRILQLGNFFIKNSDIHILLSQIWHKHHITSSVTTMCVFSTLCRRPVAISPWNTGKLLCALTRISSYVFPFLRWYEFSENCPHLRFVNCCSRNCLRFPKRKDVGAL